MSFERWLEDFNSAFNDTVINHAKYRGGLKLEGTTLLIPKGLEEKSIQLYASYKTERATKGLVFATWILATATIILSALTIFLK